MSELTEYANSLAEGIMDRNRKAHEAKHGVDQVAKYKRLSGQRAKRMEEKARKQREDSFIASAKRVPHSNHLDKIHGSDLEAFLLKEALRNG